jgi:hypothetical protein
VELAGRLKFPAFVDSGNKPKFKNYADFIVNFEIEPGSGQGFLIGWRGKNGDKALVGEPNPDQWARYAENNCVFHYRLPESMQYMRNWNQGNHEWAQQMKLRRHPDPIMIQNYAEVLQRFRLPRGARARRSLARRRTLGKVEILIPAFFTFPGSSAKRDQYPLAAIARRPMAMYHSGTRRTRLRRSPHTLLPVRQSRDRRGLDGRGPSGAGEMHGALQRSSRPGTVWTWNAISKTPALGLAPDAGLHEAFLNPDSDLADGSSNFSGSITGGQAGTCR